MQLTTNEIAKKVNRTRQRIHQYIQDGLIAAEKIGRDWLVEDTQIEVIRNLPDGRKKKVENQSMEVKP